MGRPIAYIGALLTVVFAVCSDTTSPGQVFFDLELDDTDKAKMNTLFRYMGDCGKITNPEKFGKLRDGLFEFKSFQVRMPCYYLPGKLLVVTHGFRKKRGPTRPEEIVRAQRIRQEDKNRER